MAEKATWPPNTDFAALADCLRDVPAAYQTRSREGRRNDVREQVDGLHALVRRALKTRDNHIGFELASKVAAAVDGLDPATRRLLEERDKSIGPERQNSSTSAAP